MNLYLVSQDENNDYDTYDSFVVAAPDEDTARKTSPSTSYVYSEELNGWKSSYMSDAGRETPSSWCDIEYVKVKLIGTTTQYTETTIICTSFNAG